MCITETQNNASYMIKSRAKIQRRSPFCLRANATKNFIEHNVEHLSSVLLKATASCKV